MLRQLIYNLFYKTVYPILHRPLIINTVNYKETEGILAKAMNLATSNRLEGDYLEFGVYQGESFVTAYKFSKDYYGLKSMNFYAFDSFQGQPPLSGVDAEGFQHFRQGQYYCSLDDFKKIIAKKGLDQKRVIIVPGWYKDTLNEETKKKLPLKKAAIVMVDCDLYESTVAVLDFIIDYLQDGTILIFDAWFCFRGNPNRGEHRAFQEWLKKNPQITARQYQKYALYGNSFIITVNSQ